MSEEILKALTQLFAIITKQDGGVTDTERNFVINFFKQELDHDSIKEYVELYDQFAEYGKEEEEGEEVQVRKKKLTSVKDSVKTLAICKKINKTLTQKQKVVVLVKLLELVGSDGNFTDQRIDIIDTVSRAFNIVKDEFKLIEGFALNLPESRNDFEDILVASATTENITAAKHIHTDISGEIIFLRVNSVDLYFVKYLGQDDVVLNGFIMKPNQSYLFSNGSTIKAPTGSALYYSDLIRNFISEVSTTKISFNAKNLEFRFPNNAIGLRDINIAEGPGKLIGIMGASGAGKTTLLNVLAGIETPSDGEVTINGFNIHLQKDQIQGVIGYVSQDDLLIEELTVYENLYYNAKLCFANKKEEEIHKLVLATLESLGLEHRKDLKVGSVLDKTISGGQRKRLNIALELIREPAVMFVDEPTSGLSSRDSENVIDLLKELTLKGKLIFVVIHQPSSDIYKMFDKMYLLDTGGYPIFYGNPVEAVTYFKRASNQVDAERGQCHECGNVNPEQVFNIIEAKVVDEYGQFTNKRKVSPPQWHEMYQESFNIESVAEEKDAPPKSLSIPSRIKQTVLFTIRDTLSKVSNKQYMLINFLEAPVLALFLSLIIKYKDAGSLVYSFRFNENIPAYLLMSIVVALFMGLTVSAEEIIRDRKILKRESFLNLSWNSYLSSKVLILFALSAVQTLTFVIIGNSILEIKEMTLSFWLVLFSVSCFACILGLNVSASFNSAVTVYILIPLLLIPQLILCGLLFNFDKLNSMISSKGEVPIVADMMASRWAYEAMAVYQFQENSYERPYYELEKQERQADFKSAYLIPELESKLQFVVEHVGDERDSVRSLVLKDLHILKTELTKEAYKEGLEDTDLNSLFTLEGLSQANINKVNAYFEGMKKHYMQSFNKAVEKQEKLVYYFESQPGIEYDLNDYKNRYFNESLADLVRNINVSDRIIEYEGKLLQRIDPVFNEPMVNTGFFNYRTHFFAPKKQFAGKLMDTYYFNIAVIWLMTIVLYITLYYELFAKLMERIGNLKIPTLSK
ncbi:ABC-type multidrug transport system ATPase subunit [Catalinimonas alkaloidigena]|uniref:ATP-binding cassette domain-containing protein n=1 Tax=Catalinimonas alkaloidigena TaxID=1075417 RepID=UPI0024054F35|nr:ATP-binding cassette domain-containing protein [Catalinimonas alkaloidigena]MDF9799808.1 ABC-type multidrug transport system ATPase subunit [Catalinimonas alkaloidigena]